MRAAFGVGNTKLDELEAEGIIPRRFSLWPGSVVVGWWEDEVIEKQRLLAENRAKAEKEQKESETAPASHASPKVDKKVDPPRPRSALLNRLRAKPVRR
jgi:hypothetical protein